MKIFFFFLNTLIFSKIIPDYLIDFEKVEINRWQTFCKKDLPVGSVGHYHITKANFMKIRKDNPHLLVFPTSLSCNECCEFEITIDKFIKLVLENPKRNRGLEIKVARVDIAKEPWFAADYNVEKFPEIYYFHHGTTHQGKRFIGLSNPYETMNFIYKVHRPVEYIQTKEEFDQVFKKGDIYNDPYYAKKKFVWYTTEEDSFLIKEFYDMARKLNWKEDTQFIFFYNITDELKKHMKDNYRKLIFEKDFEFEEHKIYCFDLKGDYEIKNLVFEKKIKNGDEMIEFYNLHESRTIEELTSKNWMTVFGTSKIIVQAFFDNSNRKKAKEFLEEYSKLKSIHPNVKFVYNNIKSNLDLAIEAFQVECTTPCLSFISNMPSDLRKNPDECYYVMKDDLPKTIAIMETFISKVFSGQVKPGAHDYNLEKRSNWIVFRNVFRDYKIFDLRAYKDALKNDKNYIVIVVSALEKMDYKRSEKIHNMFLDLFAFFKRFKIEFYGLIYETDIFPIFKKSSLKEFDVLILTQHSKTTRNKIIQIKENFSMLNIIQKFLQNSRIRLKKNSHFLDKERKVGINNRSIFEGITD